MPGDGRTRDALGGGTARCGLRLGGEEPAGCERGGGGGWFAGGDADNLARRKFLFDSRSNYGFDASEVFFGVDTDGVVWGFSNVDADVVFEQAKLLEALGEFEGRGSESGETLESGAAIG